MVLVKISKISDFIKGTATMKELILTFSPQKGSQKLRKQAVLTQKVRIGFLGSLKNYSSPKTFPFLVILKILAKESYIK